MAHNLWRSGQSGDYVSCSVGIRPLGCHYSALPVVLHRSSQSGRLSRHLGVQTLPVDQEEGSSMSRVS